MKEPTMEEVLELVEFGRDDDGKLCVRNVKGNVEGSVWGSVFGDVDSVMGNVEGSVWGNVLGNIYGDILCWRMI